MSDAPRTRDERTRGALEIITAILLGLVSVATAVGAFQAGQWAQQSDDLSSVSQQLRDRNLALFLESENTARDDYSRLFDALGLYAEMTFYPERTEALTREQDVIMAAASEPLAESFPAWRDAGYPLDPIDETPIYNAEYQALTFAPAQSYNLVSEIAYQASETLEEKSSTMTIVSVVFAIALLLLGIAGASSRLNVTAIMTGGGAVAFLAGLAIVLFGVF